MTISAYPFDGVDTTETEFALLFQHLQDDGLAGLPGSTDGAVTTGSGMALTVNGWELAIVGGFAVRSTSSEALTLAPGGAVARLDRVVLRVDPAQNAVTVAVLTGEPSSAPVVPSLTQTLGGVWEIPLARVAVAAGAVNVNSGAVTDERRFLSLRVGQWTTSARPIGATAGQLGYNHTSSSWEFYTGSGWKGLAPDVTWANIAGRPSTFAPSAHEHSAAGIVSGVLDAARVPGTLALDRTTKHFRSDGNIVAKGVLSGEGTTDTSNPPNVFVNSSGRLYRSTGSLTARQVATNGSNVQNDLDYINSRAAEGISAANAANANANNRRPYGNCNFENNPVYSAHARNNTVSSSYVVAYLNGDGRLGYAPSTKAKKHDLGVYSPDEAILSIPGRWYTYRDDELQTPRAGLFAEDLDEVAPEFVIHEDGKPAGIRYEMLGVAALRLISSLSDRVAELEAKLDVDRTPVPRTEPGAVTAAMRAEAADAQKAAA